MMTGLIFVNTVSYIIWFYNYSTWINTSIAQQSRLYLVLVLLKLLEEALILLLGMFWIQEHLTIKYHCFVFLIAFVFSIFNKNSFAIGSINLSSFDEVYSLFYCHLTYSDNFSQNLFIKIYV